MRFAYYAVVRGVDPGIYTSWDECRRKVTGFSNAKFGKFFCHEDAVHYLSLNGIHDHYYDLGNTWPESNYGHPYYAVSKGFTRGIFTSIPSLYKQIKHYKRCEFRRFHCREDAKRYLNGCGINHFYDESANETRPSRVLAFKKSFIYDAEGFIQVYVDGACSNNGKRGAVAGIGVWFGENHRSNVSRPVQSGKATNIVAETEAVIEALEIAEREHMHGVKIFTDSHYVIDCVEQYMHKWKRNNFVNAKGAQVANAALVRKLDAIGSRVFHRLIFVAGHSGNFGNEMADRLAKAGAQRYCR